jgi:hypothetical protein
MDQTTAPIDLTEFCRRLSEKDSRVELIGSFESAERAAKRSRDVEAAYAARFDAFATQPA